MKLSFLVVVFLFFYLKGQNYTTKIYNVDNGLPQNSIKDIIKDKYGFIWLSTEEGILRYDGSNFLQYKNFKLSSINFGDFYGNVGKDSILIFNNSEIEGLIISKRKVEVKKINKNAIPVEFHNNKRYQHFVKNTIATKFYQYIDCFL